MMFEEKDDWLMTRFKKLESNVHEKYMKTIFRPLRDFSPSDSSIIFKVEKRGSLLRGVLNIKSTQKHFTGTYYANDVYSLAENAKKDMVWQIEAWKNARYMNIAV